MATTFADIYGAVQARLLLDTTNDDITDMLKEFINDRYKELAAKYDWRFLYEKSTIATTAEYDTGTVTVSDGGTTVTGSGTAWTDAMIGRKFKTTAFEEIYTITAVASATSLTIDNYYNGDDVSAGSYKIFQDEYSLPSNCENIISLRQHRTPIRLRPLGIRELRRNMPSSYSETGDPTRYSLYEPDSNGYTKIILYPAPHRRIVLDLDYKIIVTDLSADADEPLIPESYRQTLKYGAMADMYNYQDDAKSKYWESKFQAIIKEMVGKFSRSDDTPFMHVEDRRSRIDSLQTLADKYSLGEDYFLRY